MSLVFDDKGKPVHMPRDPSKFEFDAEVASIFENMAMRSIPMYAETHRIHSKLACKHLQENGLYLSRPQNVADLGASTGVFLKYLCHHAGVDIFDGIQHVTGLAIDTSMPMLDKIELAMPWVVAHHGVASDISLLKTKFDIVNMSYLLQFIDLGERGKTLRAVYDSMYSGGLLFISAKDAVDADNELVDFFNDEYIEFRKENGYTDEEIQAKTEALRESMWVDSYSYTCDMLRNAGFVDIIPTARWLSFGSLVCRKP